MLQSRSKENQLRKLGEVEKRFGILSRQCAAFKQAHEELGQSGENMLILGFHYTDYDIIQLDSQQNLQNWEICVYFVPLWTFSICYWK